MSRLTPPRNFSHHKSDIETHLPTTTKKANGSLHKQGPCSRVNPHLLTSTILALESQKQKCIHRRKYSWAQQIDHSIRRAKSQLASSRISRLLEQQRAERRSISEAHRSEMRYFRRTWGVYFNRLQQRESQILRCFKEEQEREVFEAQLRVRLRSRSIRSRSGQVAHLTRKEALLREKEDFSYLKYVRQQLAEAVLKERRKKAKAMERLAELEEERLSMAQSKKYSVLLSRLQEYRRDKERVYLREQKRLRQKYRNVVHQLEHQQAMEFEEKNRLSLVHPY